MALASVAGCGCFTRGLSQLGLHRIGPLPASSCCLAGPAARGCRRHSGSLLAATLGAHGSRSSSLQASRLGHSASNSGEFGVQEVEWLKEQLSSELVEGGLDSEESSKIGAACAEACGAFFASGFGPFDPMVIMDVMEEEVERRGLRGDFLPFEIARKALQVLQRRWDGPRRPTLLREARENMLDVVNFDKFPKAS